MDEIKENIHSLQVPTTSNKRRLSLIKNDDFAFPSHKRKEQTTEWSDVISLQKQSNNEGSNYDSVPREFALTAENNAINKNSNNSHNKENAEDNRYDQIWKNSNDNSMMRYKWIRKLRNRIIMDLKRHFGREIMHDRLFSCLGKATLN